MFMLDYGPHEDCVFLVALEDGGDMKHYTARQVKICKNHTFDIRTRMTDWDLARLAMPDWHTKTRYTSTVINP